MRHHAKLCMVLLSGLLVAGCDDKAKDDSSKAQTPADTKKDDPAPPPPTPPDEPPNDAGPMDPDENADGAKSACSTHTIGSPAWLEFVGRESGVIDDQGHGPDPASDEWNTAVNAKVAGDEDHGPDLGTDEWQSSIDHRLCAKKTKKN